jgi:hypothetical protein
LADGGDVRVDNASPTAFLWILSVRRLLTSGSDNCLSEQKAAVIAAKRAERQGRSTPSEAGVVLLMNFFNFFFFFLILFPLLVDVAGSSSVPPTVRILKL